MAHAPHSIDELLELMVGRGASDLHITVGTPPAIRTRGHVSRLEDYATLDPDTTRSLLYQILSTEQQKRFEVNRQLDFSHSIPGVARFRVNVYMQRESVGAAFRVIPDEIKTLEELKLPVSLAQLAQKPRGLVLVTGPTGSGKSTTLAAMIDEVNRTRHEHILTVEDPIEFVHRHKSCIVNQREIGVDAVSFGEALRGALRQDPDVILVGEMRDLETISIALTAAETGHLVLGTLHTQSAASTIDRIIDVFPAEQQEQVRIQIAGSLQGVITQALLATGDGQGRVAALEILLPDDAVRNLIRQGKVEQIYSIMQTNTSRGMQTMEQALQELVARRIVDFETALTVTSKPEQLKGLLERAGFDVPEPAGDGAGLAVSGNGLGGGLRVAGADVVDWKKEIKLGKRASAEGAAEPDAVAAAPTPAEEKVPFWKKEIGGRKKAAAPDPATAPEPIPFPEPLAIDDEPVADAVEAVPWDESDEPEDDEVEVGDDPAPELPPAARAHPEAEGEESPGAGYGWLTAGLEHETSELRSWAETTLAEIEAEIDAGVQVEHVVAPEPVEAVAEPAPEPDVVPEPEAEPVEVPAAYAPPAPAPGIHAPVPLSELPPLPGDASEAKVPFWKRDLSFGKKDADAAPKAPKAKREKAPKPKKEKAAKAAVVAVAVADAPEKVPFWKKEIGGRKTEKAPKAAKAAVAKPEKAEKPEKAPKPPKGERAPKEPKAKAAKPAKGQTRHKQLVGLKIGGSQLAAAHVRNNGHAEVTQLAREALEPGVVVGGELRDPEALAEALKAFFARHKLPKRNVRLGIANNRIGVRTLDVVGIEDPKQLANAIRFRAQEALPIPIEEAVLDYQVLSEGTNEDGESVRRVLLVVAYRELVDRYVDACRRAGVKIVGIDLEAFALLRALSEPHDGGADGSAVVAVSIGHDRTTFAVSDGRACEFTRVLEWGGFQLSVAVARALDVAPSEAEPFKKQLSLHGREVIEGLHPEQAETAREAMRKQVHTFARELVSSLQFYQGQPGSLPIGGITITGGTAHLTGLAEELQRLIGVPVHVGDPLGRVEVGKKVTDDGQLGSMAIAIGLGIED